MSKVVNFLLLCNKEEEIVGEPFKISIVLFYAATDEFHQLFVPGRGASVNDVIIDFIGGIIGLIIFYCGYYGVQHIVGKRRIKLGVRA